MFPPGSPGEPRYALQSPHFIDLHLDRLSLLVIHIDMHELRKSITTTIETYYQG